MRSFEIGKVLVVEVDAIRANERKLDLLDAKATSVDLVSYDFQALTRLAKPDHGYKFVFLGDELFTPDELREKLLNEELFEEVN